MNFKVMTVCALAGALAIGVGAAQAATTYDADLAPPGVYFGSGNPNGHFTVETVGDVELGLRARPFPEVPIAPTFENLYTVALGDTISFDWSFNGGATAPSLFSHQIKITNVGTGDFLTFDPSGIPDNDTTGNGYQNSWRLSFGFLNGGNIVIIPGVLEFPGFGDINYDPNVDSTYEIAFTVRGGASPITNTILVNQGAGAAVPEPGAWALMILGFAGAGAALRRRRPADANA